MAYNAVIQLPALFDVEGGAAALFGEQQVSDVMNSHLLFNLDRQAKIGNGHIGYRVPSSSDTSSLVEAFKETFLVGDTVAENYDSGKTNDTSLLGNGLLADLGAVHTAEAANAGHPAPDSNVATGTFGTVDAPIAIHWQNVAPYSSGVNGTGPNFLSNSATSQNIADDEGQHAPYYYDDSDGLVKGGASCILHYEDGALKSIEMVSGGTGYKIGDKVQIAVPLQIIGTQDYYEITLTKNSVNVDGGKMKFYVNMLGNKDGKYLPKYSEGSGQIASPNDVVDDFCNKFADSLIRAYSSGYVNVPHPEKAIPMGGRTVTNGKAPLYPGSICPEPSEKAGLGTTMARAAAVHLVGHPLAQALFSNEHGIEAELTAAIQEEHSKDFDAGTWDADAKFDGNKNADNDGAYGEMGYGSLPGGHDGRVGKQGFRFQSKLAKILSKIFGGSQADERKFGWDDSVDNGGEDKSLKAGNGNKQTYKQMKTKRSGDGADAPYETVAVDVVAPDCVRFAVEADVAATSPNYTNALKTIIDGTPYDHKGSVTDLSNLDLDENFGNSGGVAAVIDQIWNPTPAQTLNGVELGPLQYRSNFTTADDLVVKRNGEPLAADKFTAAQFQFLWERSADAATFTVSLKSVTCVDHSKDLNNYSDATGGSGFQAGDVLEITVEGKVVTMVLTGENILTPHIGNVDPHKIGSDHVVGSSMAAYNFMGVSKEDGVYNSILQSIYEQCLNVPGRATELDNGRNAVITAVASGGLKVSTIYDITDADSANHVGVSNVVLTEGEVYGDNAEKEIAISDLQMQSQFTQGADLSGDGKIKVTIENKLVTKVEVSVAGVAAAKLHAGDVIYVQSSDIGGGATGDLEITLAASNLTPDADQTGLWDGPYKNNVMLTRNMAGTHCIPITFPIKAGDKLVTYLRPSLKLKFDKTLLDADVNVQYLKANGELETLNVDGIVNASGDGEMGTISHTFPGMVYDLCENASNDKSANDSYHTLQEWIDQDMQHTAGNFVGVKVANPTYAQDHKFCWMGSAVHAKSNNSMRANQLASDEADVPAHTKDARVDAHLASVKISQQTTDETDNTKLDLHVWKCVVSL